MRSEDLVRSPAHDAAFVLALRERLAREPVVLAPAPVIEAPTGGARASRRWAMPVAAAAGVVVVAGVLVATRASTPPEAAAPMAANGAGAASVMALAAPASASVAPAVAAAMAEPPPQAVDGKLIRDAQLDRYLRAHRGSALAVPGGAIGRFETVVLER
jgi:sigma-E factor negative regulatory protein RseA